MTERDRPDLAAMVTWLQRDLIAAELPVLAATGASTWGYSVLTAVAAGSVRTQAALARVIGADKSRIIGVLDELQRHGLIDRRPDPADRRVHLLELTPAGRRVFTETRAGIRAMEERLLRELPEGVRQGLLRGLRTLARPPGVAGQPD